MKSSSSSLFPRILSVLLCLAILLISIPETVLAEAGELLSGAGATETSDSICSGLGFGIGYDYYFELVTIVNWSKYRSIDK